jgi:hypothetical protein
LNDWFYDRTINWSYNDYLRAVDNADLANQFGPHIFADEEGKPLLITTHEVPFIDLGDKP